MSLTVISCPCGARFAADPSNTLSRLHAQDNIRLFITAHAAHQQTPRLSEPQAADQKQKGPEGPIPDQIRWDPEFGTERTPKEGR